MKPIPSALGYFASEHGEIFNSKGRKLSASVHTKGYLRVHIGKKSYYAHALVCEAFHGPRPTPFHQTAHNDGTRTNNVPGNLRWATPKENQADRKIHGTSCGGHAPGAYGGELHGRAKLTWAEVDEIRAFRAANSSLSLTKCSLHFAGKYGVCRSTIHNVIIERTWTVRPQVAA